MTSEFKLVGLGKDGSMTCLDANDDYFWPLNNLPQDRFDALFNWAKSTDGFWKDGWIATINHTGFFEDGSPMNPVVIEIREQ